MTILDRAAYLSGLVLALALSAAGTARAQAPAAGADRQTLQAQADVLFKRILLRPNDLEADFQYAEVETALGDDEAAIGSLERMLFYNPRLPRVKLELGLLYFRLGSYAMARSYFDSALQDPDVPTDVRERIVAFSAEIDRRLSTSQFTFFGQAGVRYQSNANAGPNSLTVRALGDNATLSSDFARKADGNAFILGGLQYIYDFDNQRGDVWETNAVGYYSGQFNVKYLNLGLVEVDTGPRFALGEATGLSVRPYVLGGNITLGDAEYIAQGGGGVDLRYQSPTGIQVDLGAEGRTRAFANSAPYPTAHDQRGDQVIVPLAASGPAFIPDLRWQARLSYVHNTAFAQYYAYDQFGVEAALPYSFAGPALAQGHRWTFAPFASFFDVAYAQPEALIDPKVTRHDQLYQAGATLDMQFRDNVGVAVTAQYVANDSNLPNYRTRDFIVSAGPTFRY